MGGTTHVDLEARITSGGIDGVHHIEAYKWQSFNPSFLFPADMEANRLIDGLV